MPNIWGNIFAHLSHYSHHFSMNVVFIFLLFFLQAVQAQPSKPVPVQTNSNFYNIIRYNDRDFSFLRTDTSDHDFFNPIKYIPFSPQGSSFLTLGGELREEFRYYQNENWGDISPERIDTDGFLWHRFMVHADMRLGKHFRIFGQLKNCLVFSRAGGARPVVDEDSLDVHQAFLEVSGDVGTSGEQAFALRIGRQEYNFGAARLLTMRDGINVRQSFDALTIKYRSPSVVADAFIGQGLDTKRGIFDDERMRSETTWGLYTTTTLQQQPERTTSLDAYYIGFERAAWRFAGVMGKDQRHSFGGRVNSRAKEGLNAEAEAIFQTGTFAKEAIFAYLFAGSVNYTFTLPLQPALGLGWSVASGDQNPTDRISNTFNPMYPKPIVTFGQALASTNLSILQPFLNLSIAPPLQLQLTAYFLALTSAYDGLYAVSTVQSRIAPALKRQTDPNAETKRLVGNQYSALVTWNIQRHLRLFVEATYFTAGEYLRLTGAGRDMFYGAVQLQLTF
ncbi:MAG: hypothetical protein EAZ92_01660 [Candidatus Kapaibacterium sp.]|nr:MAG: hypothetical protein EAZ92_01660 [Candidatus Kapabacteria bacterium]